LDGCVVYFRVGREGAPADIGSGAVFTTHRGAVAEAFFWTAIVVVFVGAIALTIRNVTRERGHRQAANWIAIIVLGGGVVAGLLRAHHVPSVIEETSFVLGVTGWSAIWAAFCWVGYLGLEPPLRRHAPQVLGAWTRVFAGRLRDSVVGRDVLIGVAGGLALVALATIRFRLWPDRSADMVLYHALETLRSWRRFTFVQLLAALDAVQTAVAAGLLVALLRPIVRRGTVAACLVALLSIPISIGGIPLSPKDGALAATVMLIGAVIFLRAGLLALAITFAVERLIAGVPITLDGGSWYFPRSLASLLVVAALVVYGAMVTCLASRPPAFGARRHASAGSRPSQSS